MDVDRSGVVTSTDALRILSAAVGTVSITFDCQCDPTTVAQGCGDVDGSGAVTSTDALRTLSASVGLIPTIGTCPCCLPGTTTTSSTMVGVWPTSTTTTTTTTIVHVTSPVDGTLEPCVHDVVIDVYRLSVSEGDTVFIEADTRKGKGADLAFQHTLSCGGVQISTPATDDVFPCSSPIPFGSCPRVEFVTTSADVCPIVVQTVGDCVDPMIGKYRLTVRVNDKHAAFLRIRDDFYEPL